VGSRRDDDWEDAASASFRLVQKSIFDRIGELADAVNLSALSLKRWSCDMRPKVHIAGLRIELTFICSGFQETATLQFLLDGLRGVRLSSSPMGPVDLT
jgi:hypothetical protein